MNNQKLIWSAYYPEIEKSVSSFLGKPWKISESIENKNGAMHRAVILKGSNFDIFVKAGNNSFSPDQFRQEALGLKYLREHTPVSTPLVIDVLEFNGTVLLILEAVDTRKPERDEDWRVLGRGLALINKVNNDRCGLHTHSYLGIFHQDNSYENSWHEFYGERRLRPQMKMAVDRGMMTLDQCRPVEDLIKRLPLLCDNSSTFSLLHGDPWPGNLLYDGNNMIAIDCGIYYGNREIDLSTVAFFHPVPQAFFQGYHEIYPIDPGYKEREDLWRVNQWLGHVTLFGEKNMKDLMNAVKKYL